MRAILIAEDKSLVWSEVPMPVYTESQVLIRIKAAALNRADLLQREGKYPSPPGSPQWMGLEIAGEIVSVGRRVSRWKLGDKVCALLGGGGYAEYVAVDAGMVLPLPKRLTMEEGASLPEAYATCYLNLFTEGNLRPGETLYFPAGASGLASVGIPMAKACGAYVITSVLTPEKTDAIQHLGADRVIVHSHEKVSEVLRKEAESGHPVDVSVDCLGGPAIGETLPYVAEGCRWILISTLDGTETVLPLRAVLTKGLQIKGSMLRKKSVAEKSELLARLEEEFWPLLEAGRLRPTLYRVLPITQAEEAHALLQHGENVGKVVLQVP
ncbi:MAG: NAD(P)H-quinone oxidoreductase [Christensenellales bacterium]|jgi:NADPH2:quinone reductase